MEQVGGDGTGEDQEAWPRGYTSQPNLGVRALGLLEQSILVVHLPRHPAWARSPGRCPAGTCHNSDFPVHMDKHRGGLTGRLSIPQHLLTS